MRYGLLSILICVCVRPCVCVCLGIDLMDMASEVLQPEGDDMARTSWNMRKTIAKYQETFSVIEKVNGQMLSCVYCG